MPLDCGCSSIELKSCAPYASLETVSQILDDLCDKNCYGEVEEAVSEVDFMEEIGASSCCQAVMVKRGNCLFISVDGGDTWQEFCNESYTFKAYSTITQNFPNTTETLVNYNTVLWDTNTFYTTSTTFTIPVTGYYLLIANFRVANDAANHRFRLRIYNNATIVAAVMEDVDAFVLGEPPGSIISSSVAYCVAGDVISLTVQPYDGALVKDALALDNNSNSISIHKI